MVIIKLLEYGPILKQIRRRIHGTLRNLPKPAPSSDSGN